MLAVSGIRVRVYGSAGNGTIYAWLLQSSLPGVAMSLLIPVGPREPAAGASESHEKSRRLAYQRLSVERRSGRNGGRALKGAVGAIEDVASKEVK